VAIHVLAVDDNEINLRLVQHVLEERGFSVECVKSGMEALTALDRRRPDLVILDIMMPGLDGGEVLDRIKASPRLASIPVIMLTAKSSDQDLIDSYRSGADYYITKPLVARQLLHGISLVLGHNVPASPATSQRGARPRSQRSPC
jgi:two-component system, OmpR family, alkaline phosphatase synthesis response regulator PhoP